VRNSHIWTTWQRYLVVAIIVNKMDLKKMHSCSYTSCCLILHFLDKLSFSNWFCHATFFFLLWCV
jgi:hypothetical protein